MAASKLLDLESTSPHSRRASRHADAKSKADAKGKGGRGAPLRGKLPEKHDVGVRGYLPRVNRTALVSRFNPAARAASRYMHMATIAKVGDRCEMAVIGRRNVTT
eukprot:1071016-Prorocentrum_minimum.AAC.6